MDTFTIRDLRALSDAHIIIYEPKGAPGKMAHNRKAPDMTPGRAALLALINRYLNGLYSILL